MVHGGGTFVNCVMRTLPLRMDPSTHELMTYQGSSFVIKADSTNIYIYKQALSGTSALSHHVMFPMLSCGKKTLSR
jgi:hypothetical protein